MHGRVLVHRSGANTADARRSTGPCDLELELELLRAGSDDGDGQRERGFLAPGEDVGHRAGDDPCPVIRDDENCGRTVDGEFGHHDQFGRVGLLTAQDAGVVISRGHLWERAADANGRSIDDLVLTVQVSTARRSRPRSRFHCPSRVARGADRSVGNSGRDRDPTHPLPIDTSATNYPQTNSGSPSVRGRYLTDRSATLAVRRVASFESSTSTVRCSWPGFKRFEPFGWHPV